MKTPIHRFKTLKGYTIFENGMMLGKSGKYLKPQPESVPINALVPVKGTPLQNQTPF